jgi:hypothetical protein
LRESLLILRLYDLSAPAYSFHKLFSRFCFSGAPMRKLLVAAVVVAGWTGVALAADMPPKAQRPAAVVTNWTGFYVGIVAGGEIGRASSLPTSRAFLVLRHRYRRTGVVA